MGELHHIRAQWHRGNLPGKDSWSPPLPGGEIPVGGGDRIDAIADKLNSLAKKKLDFEKQVKAGRAIDADAYDLCCNQLAQWTQWDADKTVEAHKYGYEDRMLEQLGRNRPALEELIRWRVWDRTGGGLMAELGSHQLDAASIFISAMHEKKHVHPLTVHAVGGRTIFPQDRDADGNRKCRDAVGLQSACQVFCKQYAEIARASVLGRRIHIAGNHEHCLQRHCRGGITRHIGRTTRRLRRKAGVTRAALPKTVQQTVKKRLQRLDEKRRRVLAVASVLGRSFDYEDLEALLGGEDDLDELVDALLEEEMLEEDGRSRGDRLRFASTVVSDVLYRELPRRRRRKLHRQHAERLEKRHAGQLERVYPDLVHHFSEAEVADKTVRYGLELARFSLASFSPDKALFPARTALELIDEDEIVDAAAVRGELLLLVARAEHLGGHFDEALFEAEQAFDFLFEARDLEKAAEAALFLAEATWQGRQGSAARRWVEHGLSLAHCGEEQSTLRGLLTLGATLANLRGEYAEAQRYLREMEELMPTAAEKESQEVVPEGGALVTALPNPVISLDPARLHYDEQNEVATTLYETLLTTDDDGALRPQLCESWEASTDGKLFELMIRPDVCFSDGSPLLARDVKASIERYLRHGSADLTTAFSALATFASFIAGERRDVQGVEAPDEHRIVFRLSEPLPIFLALLTQPNTAIVKESEAGARSPELLGTGPFVLASQDANRILLARNPRYWQGSPPPLEQIEFRTALDAAGIATGLRSGEIDLGRDLLPADLEEILGDPRFRSGLVEATKKTVSFVLFNTSGPAARQPALRRALAGVVRPQDLVWRSLGRFAQPASSFIPPGILGHDPGRRYPMLSREEARSLLQELGICSPIELRAAVSPLFQDRYGSLTRALLEEWSALGVEVTSLTPTMDDFLRRYQDSADIDLLIGRYVADYDDPDTFTSTLFRSKSGLFQSYYSSSRGDELMEKARQEKRSGTRQAIYQQFEDLLNGQSVLVPLFHDVNYRIANPNVRGLKLFNTLPYVNYSTVGKSAARSEPRTLTSRAGGRSTRKGEIHVPIQGRVDTFDPAFGLFLDNNEVSGNIFETLVVEEGARLVPGLAEAFEARKGGCEYYFRLRNRVRFHDGRRLTARDVRYSFERILRSSNEEVLFPILPIRGARAFRNEQARELAGFRILSATEFLVELDEPLAFFPSLLATGTASIVPEGSRSFVDSWRDGCVGTGAFRVARFDSGERIELERNPEYWRPGYPRSDRLVFHLGISPGKAAEGFREGRLTLVSNLLPDDLEALRRTPELMAGYQEVPRLGTYFLAFSVQQGPFVDPDLRRDFFHAFDINSIVRETAGRLVLPASGLIPPGYLGHEASAPRKPHACETPETLRRLRLRILAQPVYNAQYKRFWDRLCRTWTDAGIQLEIVPASTVAEADTILTESAVDLSAHRWIADFLDTDGIVGRVLHSEGGDLRKICSTPEIDRLIEAGRREVDFALRHAIYRKIEETLARDALLIPLFHEQAYRFCRPGVEGLRLTYGTPEVRYEELSVQA